ncbi:MAG: redoxin domain-containing protein [Planctomycetes bacterium]|nr:redoxin domain-containing protein [Planctomycetota bacterium]
MTVIPPRLGAGGLLGACLLLLLSPIARADDDATGLRQQFTDIENRLNGHLNDIVANWDAIKQDMSDVETLMGKDSKGVLKGCGNHALATAAFRTAQLDKALAYEKAAIAGAEERTLLFAYAQLLWMNFIQSKEGELNRLYADIKSRMSEPNIVGAAERYVNQVKGCGGKARDFTTKDLDGKPVSLSALRGKVVLVFFWDTSTPGSQRDLPSVLGIAKQLLDDPDFGFISLSLDKDIAAVRRKLQECNITCPQVWGEADCRGAKGAMGVKEIPWAVVVDDGGIVRRQGPGLGEDSIALVKDLMMLLKARRKAAGGKPGSGGAGGATSDIDRECKGLLAMGEQFERNGMAEKAIEKYQSIITKHPNTPHAAEARKRIDRLKNPPPPEGKKAGAGS